MNKIFVCFVSALVVSATAWSAETQPLATVTGGRMEGRSLEEGGAVFKGIPFAAPPTGSLRWHEPMPVVPWHGVRDASDYAATCAQISAGWNNKIAARGSEDCLYLNVWTPEWPAKPGKPVMFWIHGGGNMGGSALGQGGIEPPFDGTSLARHGVVVVTINYRLGVFGYLAHPELTKESAHHASGNYGLLDQIAALKWVQENIARFGGDPANVTIFGQSAGAHDVGLLLSSSLAKGLFRRAVQESGSVIIGGRLTFTLAQAEQFGTNFTATLGANSLAQMRALSTADIIKESPAYSSGVIGPDVDGYAITVMPSAVFASGKEQAVPLLIGNNSRERTLAGGQDELRKAIESFYGSLAPRALDLYGLNGKAQTSAYPPHGEPNAQFETDLMFRCSGVTIANWHAAAKNIVYEYEFSHPFPERPDRGAIHSGELRYIFGVLPGQPDAKERKISDDMETYWTNYAKSGDPNSSGLPAWPKFDTKAAAYLEFTDNGPVAKEALRRSFCAVFEERVKQLMAKAQ